MYCAHFLRFRETLFEEKRVTLTPSIKGDQNNITE